MANGGAKAQARTRLVASDSGLSALLLMVVAAAAPSSLGLELDLV